MDEANARERMILHYRIIDEIGEGGFGRVFKAQNTALEDRVVAIKILHGKHNSPEKRKRFQQEAQILLRLNHQYILRFVDLLPYEHDLYLITEYAVRGSLRDRIDQSSSLLPAKEVDQILSQIGRALQYIHQQNIMHLDLKPANILFNAQGEALLADFGIAKIAAEVGMEKNEMVRGGTGTPHYMAPEQIRGIPTPQSDQYAFSCMIYELLAGRTPFIGTSSVDLWEQHLTKQPIDPREFHPQIPEFRAQALLKALAKNPADRHVDTEAFLAALRVPVTKETIVTTSHPSQKDINELLEKAKALLQVRRAGVALSVCNQAINLDPKSAEAFCGKGEALKGLGDTWGALIAYSHAESLNHEFIPAYIGKGGALYALGHYPEALQAYQKAVQITPNAIFYEKIAALHIKLHETEKALAAYEAAIRYGANPIETRYRKIALLKPLHRDLEVAREFDRIIQSSPDPLPARHEKKDFFLAGGHYKEALAECEQIIKQQPDAIAVYYQVVALQEQRGDSDDSLLASYRRIIERFRHDTGMRYKMIDLLEKKPGGLEEALEICNQIISRTPDDIEAHYRRLGLLESLERYDDVVSQCDEIIQREPDNADTHYRKAQAYLALGYAAQRNKGDNELLKELLMIFLRIRFNPPFHYKRAHDACTEALRVAPDNPRYRKSLADILEQLGKLQQAKSVDHGTGSPCLTWVDRLRIALLFLLLPFVINAAPIGLLVAFWQPLEVTLSMVVVAFCISGVCAFLIYKNDQLHHLYDTSILLLPIFCFALEWLITTFLNPIFGRPATVIYSCLGFFIGGLFLNTFIYFWIDSEEEQTVFSLGKVAWKGIKGAFSFIWICLTCLYTCFVIVGEAIDSADRKYKELQRILATRKTSTKTVSTPRKTNTVPRTPSPAKSYKGSLPKETRTAKKPIYKKKPNNRQNR